MNMRIPHIAPYKYHFHFSNDEYPYFIIIRNYIPRPKIVPTSLVTLVCVLLTVIDAYGSSVFFAIATVISGTTLQVNLSLMVLEHNVVKYDVPREYVDNARKLKDIRYLGKSDGNRVLVLVEQFYTIASGDFNGSESSRHGTLCLIMNEFADMINDVKASDPHIRIIESWKKCEED